MTGGGDPATTLVLAAGCTATASIPDISAAGADPSARRWTPTADAELLTAGAPVTAPGVPRSPSGCPTPAVVTRAARDLTGFDVVVLDAGLDEPPGVDVRDTGAAPGQDVRDATAVPNAEAVFERASAIGRSLTAERLLLAETIPGGTTTAMGVLGALGERTAVSSSLPENPIERKRAVLAAGLAASGIAPGDAAGDPVAAVRAMGDPVLATLAGLARGAARDAELVLAGGTQLACVGALLRHAGVDSALDLATTSYVARDESAATAALATDLDLSLRVTDPGFGDREGDGLARYAAGEAKEGVGMGAALALAADRGIDHGAVADRAAAIARGARTEAR